MADEILHSTDTLPMDDNDNEIEDESEDPDFSLDELLVEKVERIAFLERIKDIQDGQLEEIQTHLNVSEIKHKEELYFLQLELDNQKRDNVANEERMAELYQDLQDMVTNPSEAFYNSSSSSLDLEKLDSDTAQYIAQLQHKVETYERTMGVLDNQITMVKTSCDHVVKTMKEEIADLMEDRCRIEIDLLNQLARMDTDKRQQTIELKEQVQHKKNVIARLKITQGGIGGAAGSHDYQHSEELESEIARLRSLQKETQDAVDQERADADDTIHRLEDANAKLEQKLESAADVMSILRSQPDSAETSKALDRITKEREDVVQALERVSTIWERADASIQHLENAMDQLRPNDNVEIEGDCERLLSTLESASLVHGQVKVSLLLIELKLRNQLGCLNNDKLAMQWAAPPDTKVVEKMRQIQQEALRALGHVQDALSQQIQQMEGNALKETGIMNLTLEERDNALKDMQGHHKTLEEEIQRSQKTRQQASHSANSPTKNGSPIVRSASAEENFLSPEKPPSTPMVNNAVLIILHTEVIKVAEHVQKKNSAIGTLSLELEEYRVREQVLKKELKRVMTQVNGDGKTNIVLVKKERRTSEFSKNAKVLLSPTKATPSKQQFVSPSKSPANAPSGDLQIKLTSKSRTMVVKGDQSPTPIEKAAPLQPSAGDLSTPKPPLLLSPAKTTTPTSQTSTISPLQPSAGKLSMPKAPILLSPTKTTTPRRSSAMTTPTPIKKVTSLAKTTTPRRASTMTPLQPRGRELKVTPLQPGAGELSMPKAPLLLSPATTTTPRRTSTITPLQPSARELNSPRVYVAPPSSPVKESAALRPSSLH
jgi:hypothetical protein